MSQFTPVMVFRLWEKFSDTCLEVSESMEVHGKRTFGYDCRLDIKGQQVRDKAGKFIGICQSRVSGKKEKYDNVKR